jgi:hypothetical protein
VARRASAELWRSAEWVWRTAESNSPSGGGGSTSESPLTQANAPGRVTVGGEEEQPGASVRAGRCVEGGA